MDKSIFRNISYGLYIVTSLDKGTPAGCVANSIIQITSEPATIALSMNHDNFTNTCITGTNRFAVSILSEHSDSSLIGTFGFQSGKDKNTDKFKDIAYDMVEGIPVIKDTCGYIICDVIDTMETDTHTVFLGKVVNTGNYDLNDPMTYAYYHHVIKGKSPKNAPTFIKEEGIVDISEANVQKHRYVCQVCGYIYEGEKLPEGFKCPVCGQGADRFKMVE